MWCFCHTAHFVHGKPVISPCCMQYDRVKNKIHDWEQIVWLHMQQNHDRAIEDPNKMILMHSHLKMSMKTARLHTPWISQTALISPNSRNTFAQTAETSSKMKPFILTRRRQCIMFYSEETVIWPKSCNLISQTQQSSFAAATHVLQEQDVQRKKKKKEKKKREGKTEAGKQWDWPPQLLSSIRVDRSSRGTSSKPSEGSGPLMASWIFMAGV